ncbi:MAG: hypothetical protein KAQ83_01630, partial [Nanoarchaeota archaeon]|nr:hypothetical protein [Nanoarchaeota archaeon]
MKLQAIAVFIIFLVLGIPIYSADVYADQISAVSISGSDDVESIRKLVDTTHLEAVVFGEDITVDRVYLTSGDVEEVFDSCSVAEVGYLCVKDLTEDEWPDGSYNFPIKLYSQAQELMSTMYGSIKTDNNKPEITSFILDKNKGSLDDTIEITYNAYDTAYTGCSGISKVEFYSEGSLILERLGNGQCNLQESFVINVSEIGESEGKKTISLKAYDLLGLESSFANMDFTIDNSGPVIVGSLDLVKADGEPLVYVPANGINTVMSVRVSASDFNNVKAQMIELNPYYYTYEEFILGNCVEDSGEYLCEWDVNVDVDESINANVNFQLKDDTGNVNEVSLSYSLKVDTDGPSVTNLETNFGSYIGKETNFTLVVSEAGSGLSNANVYVNFASIGAGTLQADSCNSTAGGWRCYWNGVDSSIESTPPEDMDFSDNEDVVPIIVMPSSTDDMGNYIQGKLMYNMTLDTQDPYVNEPIQIIPMPGPYGYPVNMSFPKTGDTLYFLINLSDGTDITADIDLSEVLVLGGSQEVSCIGETYKMCELNTGEVMMGPHTGVIDFTFTDKTGNSLDWEEELVIFGVDNESMIYERWLIDNDPNEDRMPNAVDSDTVSLVGYDVYFPIKIRRKYNGYTMPLEIYDFECANGSEMLGEDAYLIGENCYLDGLDDIEPACTNFYAVAPLKESLYEKDFEFSCSFKIISLYGDLYNRRVSAPEEHSLDLKVNFDEIHLGTLDKALQDKVNSVRSNELVGGTTGSIIGTLNDVFEIGNKLCNMITFTRRTLSSINIALYPISKIPGVGSAIDPIMLGIDSINSVVRIAATASAPVCGMLQCKSFIGWDFANSMISAVDNYMSGEFIFELLGAEGLNSLGESFNRINQTDVTSAEAEAEYQTCIENAKDPELLEGDFVGENNNINDCTAFCNLEWSEENVVGVPTDTEDCLTYCFMENEMSFANAKTMAELREESECENIKSQVSTAANLLSMASPEPKDSLVTSVATLCLPGIVYNLEKARQIDCYYVYCMEQQVTGGTPPFVCTLQRHYAWCKFVWGEIWHLFPASALVSKLIESFAAALKDPLAALQLSIQVTCSISA